MDNTKLIFRDENITLETEEIKYEQVKRQTRERIESLYYGIDSLEDQIAVAEQLCVTAEKDYEIAKLRNQLGLIPEISILPGADSLAAAKLECENARLKQENARASLAQYKAQYAFLTDSRFSDLIEIVNSRSDCGRKYLIMNNPA